jgi:tetratricopeptide (TPR) repeat protein
MKRILMITAGLVVTLNAFSQADVTSAFNANKQGDFAKAAEYIDKAINDPKAVTKEKTWRYRGDIYLNIAGDTALQNKFPKAVQICIESYAKSIELDSKKDYLGENSTGLGKLRGLVIERAIAQYEAKDFCNAAISFRQSATAMEKVGVIDTVAIYNSAYSSMNCFMEERYYVEKFVGNTSAGTSHILTHTSAMAKDSTQLLYALVGFQQCVKLSYGLPQTYSLIADVQQKLGKMDEALKTLQNARQLYPKDTGLLQTEVNIYLADSNYTKAIDILKALSIEDPKNEVIWLVLASTNEKLGNPAEVEACYLKAIEVNPKNYDALYNLGASYYNRGNDKAVECGKINYKEKVKFEECEKAANALYMKAVTQLELAYNVSPKNKEVIVALKMAYTSSGNFEGQKKMEEALKGL